MSWKALLSLAALVSCRPAVPPAVVPFIEDDAPRAFAEAKRSHKPVFVDVWAEWCQPCMAMKRTVFTDASLAPLRDRFVWLSLDADKETNRAFLEAHPSETLPSLFVFDPVHGDRIVLRWGTFASASTLHTLLEASRADAEHPDDDDTTRWSRWLAAYDEAAMHARTADERIAFDAPRTDLCLALGTPTRAIPMLEASERDFPRWFAPPMHLARVYLAEGRLDEAESAVARARARISGRRALPVLELEAAIRRARATR